jgi:hypothetical protein
MAIRDFYSDVDLKANQLFNSRLHNIGTAARIILGGTLSTSDKGYMVYDTDLFSPYFWDGTQWNAASGIAPNLQEVTDIGAITTNPTWFQHNEYPSPLGAVNIGKLNTDPTKPAMIIASNNDDQYTIQFGDKTAESPYLVFQDVVTRNDFYYFFTNRTDNRWTGSNINYNSFQLGAVEGGLVADLTNENTFLLLSNVDNDSTLVLGVLKADKLTGVGDSDRVVTSYLPNVDGVLALSVNGNFADDNGDITIDVSGYVPYTGATADVDLGTYTFSATTITGNSVESNSFSTISGKLAIGDGYISMWDSTSAVTIGGLAQSLTDTLVQIGQDNQPYFKQIDSDGNVYVIRGRNTDQSSQSYSLALPNTSGTLALSVNGNYADSAGNITITAGGSVGFEQNFMLMGA